METLITSGRVADVILAVVVLEAALLAVFARRRLGVGAVIAMLAPGVCLVVALRFALTGAAWPLIAAALAASFLAHGLDVAVRLRARTKTPGAA